MSRDQLQILESSGTRKASVSPSPSMRGPQADLNLTASEDQTDTSRLSLEPGEVREGGAMRLEFEEKIILIVSQYRGGQVTCLDNFSESLQPGETTGMMVSFFIFHISHFFM